MAIGETARGEKTEPKRELSSEGCISACRQLTQIYLRRLAVEPAITMPCNGMPRSLSSDASWQLLYVW